MNKLLLSLSLATVMGASAGVNTDRLHLTGPEVLKSDRAMTVNMSVDPAQYRVKSNDYIVLTPILAGPADSVALPAVTVAGRHAWYQEVRNSKGLPALLRAGKRAPFDYSATVPYEGWMDHSTLLMRVDTVSECNCRPPRSGFYPVAEMEFTPPLFISDKNTFSYIEPADSVEKIFNLSGRANVIFKVNSTDIDWTYLSNYAELDTILSTINVVKDNPDATVERITLTGYASPEGPYANNVRLAKGRTEAVRKYVASRADLPAELYSTSSVPEDWAGLRTSLELSSIPDKDKIIALIDDGSIPVERKNDVLKARFPEQYRFLLDNVYPLLRHTDYLITYRIRRYYDVKEIEAVMKSNPRNLSLNEFFLLANSYEKGSPEYYSVFLTAARLSPDNVVANMNAAYSAIDRGELESARLFLERVPASPEAFYAWGILYAKEGKFEEALEQLKGAEEGGVERAGEAIQQVKRLMTPNPGVTTM